MVSERVKIYAEALLEAYIGLERFPLEYTPGFDFLDTLAALRELGCRVELVGANSAEVHPPRHGAKYQRLIAL